MKMRKRRKIVHKRIRYENYYTWKIIKLNGKIVEGMIRMSNALREVYAKSLNREGAK